MKTAETKCRHLCPDDMTMASGHGSLTSSALADQNETFSDTAGLSQNNSHAGFVPGYQDTQTGETHISRYANGKPAPIHLLEGLPDDWVARRDAEGHVAETKSGIVAGFIRDGEFFTRDAVLETLSVQNID